METEKKPNGGYSRLKKKYAMLLETHKEEMAKGREQLSNAEAKIKELEEKYGKMIKDRTEISETIKEKSETIRKQGNKIIELTDDLSKSQGEARGYRRKFEEAVRRMGGFRRFIYGYSIPQFTDEDRWHD